MRSFLNRIIRTLIFFNFLTLSTLTSSFFLKGNPNRPIFSTQDDAITMSSSRNEEIRNSSVDRNHTLHTIIAAKSITELLVKESLMRQNSGRMVGGGPKEISYHDGETIASIYTDSFGNVTKCKLIEIKRIEDQDRILNEFARDNRPVQKISFRTMLSVITACQSIDPDFLNSQPSLNHTYNQFSPSQMDPYNKKPIDLLTMSSVISGILPGTKWCGLGDIAEDYEDLGKEKNLDKCCRAHDHCPKKLRSFRSGYGLINWSLYTKSHCECDSLLYECLKGAGTPTAELLGNFYFNILRVQCIDEESPLSCMKRDDETNRCRIWGPDEGSPRKMVFRDVRRQF